jgi:RND family efflux transporter MFP subunit
MWILPPLIFGIAAVLLAPKLQRGPQMEAVTERTVKVRAMKVSKLAVIPRVIGYGTVSPGRSWQAVAEVAGQVAWTSEDLKSGHTIPTGSELLRIEESNYSLALAQVDAQLKAIEVKSRTTLASLSIAEKELKLLQDDQDRTRSLAESDLVSQATVEASERLLLNSEAKVQDLKNALDLNEAERQVQIATKKVAQLDLDRTRIAAPFKARIVDVNVDAMEYVNTGQLLFTADGLDVAEVEAAIVIGRMRPLIQAEIGSGHAEAESGILGLNAIVRLRTATRAIEWPARVVRVAGAVDQQTQSLSVVVAVDRPTDAAKPGNRPPLFRNTFVEVELTASPMADQIVVPVSAIHQGRIYVVNDEDRLEVRPVKVNFTQEGFAVLEKGIKPGERIVTSDLASAVPGMLLAPQEDKKSKRRLVTEATGKEPQK